MFLAHSELFTAALESLGEELRAHEQFMLISACASTLIACETDAAQLSHEQLLLLAHNLGFALPTHEALRWVTAIVQRFRELKAQHDEALRQTPVQPFDALFYRDRHGRLMARFSMGHTIFPPVELDEEWETMFVRVYHESLVRALAIQSQEGPDGVHEPEDGRSADE